jgi:hypothetical protein
MEQREVIYKEFRPLLNGESGKSEEKEENLRRIYSLISQLKDKAITKEMVELFGSSVTAIGRKLLKEKAQEFKEKPVSRIY